jgi:ATP-binding cassette subfamily B protein
MQEKPRSRRSLSVLWQLAQFVRPYRATLVGAGVALVFTACVTLSIGQGLRILIDEGLSSGSPQQLRYAVTLFLFLSLMMAAGTFLRFYLVSWLGERVSADIRAAVFTNIIGLHPSYFEENRSGEIMSRLTTDTTLLQTIIGSSFSMALRSCLTLVGALIMLLFTNLKLTAIVLACVPLVLMPILLYGRRVRALSNKSQDSIAHVGSYAGEIIQHIKTVQSYTREEFERREFSAEVENAFLIARRRVRQRATLIAIVILLVFGGLASMFWVGGSDVMSGAMSAGELGAFVFYAVLVATAVSTISEVWGELQRAAGATERLMELLHERSLIDEPPEPAVRSGPQPELKLEAVSFAYPSRPLQPALEKLSLNVEPGKSLALVGPSGAGKSTVFELLQRFYDPQQGRILLGDTDIRELSSTTLREHIAVVPQSPAMFTADVAYNIGYGKPGATEEEITAAAVSAHADDFIRKLPQGYQSHLGEQGVRLSGGQKQRIAIARAILKDPEILLLDEATSALDAESEFQVQLALEELMENRTTIIIAHRLSTILHADQIAVLDQGRLVATGTHNSLLHECELYRRLANLQFKSEEVA